MSPYTYWITNIISDTCNLNEYTGALMYALVCRRQSIAAGRVVYLGLLCEIYFRDEF